MSFKPHTNTFLKNSVSGSVVLILEEDYDHHKGYTEYLIEFVKYCPICDKQPGDKTWVKGGFFYPNWVEVSELQAPILEVLYGRKVKRDT